MERAPTRSTVPPVSEGLERLSAAIEHDIVPRLLVGHRAGPLPPGVLIAAADDALEGVPEPLSAREADRVEELVRRLVAPDDAPVDGYVDALREQGISCETVYLDLLAPAARRLGEMWEEDTCDFVQVTMALGRIHRILRSLSHLFLAGAAPDAPAGRIFLTCLPGEQHTLGLVMVAEFFVRAGWWTDLGHPLTEAELLHSVRAEWYDVVGVSMACDQSFPRLKRELQAIRRTSRNPAVRLLVGGRAFDTDPALVRRVGADGCADDPREAPRIAASLLNGAAARA